MRRYVYLSCDCWVSTAGYGQDARDLYLWAWTNLSVDGVTGIGRVPAASVAAEVLLSPRRVEAAWEVLVKRGKIVRDGDWYFVLSRPRHTCFRDDGKPHPKMAASARKFFGNPSIPRVIRDRFCALYGEALGILPIGYPTLHPETETQTETDSETKEKRTTVAGGAADAAPPAVPAELVSLELYSQDQKRCRACPRCFPSGRRPSWPSMSSR